MGLTFREIAQMRTELVGVGTKVMAPDDDLIVRACDAVAQLRPKILSQLVAQVSSHLRTPPDSSAVQVGRGALWQVLERAEQHPLACMYMLRFALHDLMRRGARRR